MCCDEDSVAGPKCVGLCVCVCVCRQLSDAQLMIDILVFEDMFRVRDHQTY